jgi:hypothetical protein
MIQWKAQETTAKTWFFLYSGDELQPENEGSI